jgi:hypothetical protein
VPWVKPNRVLAPVTASRIVAARDDATDDSSARKYRAFAEGVLNGQNRSVLRRCRWCKNQNFCTWNRRQ